MTGPGASDLVGQYGEFVPLFHAALLPFIGQLFVHSMVFSASSVSSTRLCNIYHRTIAFSVDYNL
jgi:hypothetical protein